MKSIWIGIVMSLLVGTAWAGSSLVLDEKNGLDEKIEVQAYDGRKGTVKVKSSAGILQQPLSSFSKTNQVIICKWIADENFKSSSRLRIKIDEDVQTEETSMGEVETYTYIVTLENRDNIALEGVTVDCSIFYEKRTTSSEEKIRADNSEVVTIPPNEKVVIKSGSVRIRDEIKKGTNANENGEGGTPSQYFRDKLEGVLLTLKRTDRNGEVVTRESKDGSPPKPDKRSDYQK